MKQNIAVVYGGFSSEVEISKKSGLNVVRCMDRNLFNVYGVLLTRGKWCVEMPDGTEYSIDRADFSFTLAGTKIHFDKAFIIIHGDPGENGILQAYFDMIGQKYVGSSSLVTSITFDKFACKRYLAGTGIKMAREVFLRRTDDYDTSAIIAELGLPVFVKPNNGGSSFGVTKVKNIESLNEAITAAFKEGDTLIIESAITGHEIDCGVYRDSKGVHALPVTEIISENEFFDYEAKYLGKSREVCPAEVPADMSAAVQDAAVKIFNRLGCTGMVRMDFMVSDDGVYFLEVNPNPGMTAESIYPKMLRAAGIDVTDFLTTLILDR